MPGITALVLLYCIAGWAIAAGVLEIVGAIRLRKEIDNEWWLIAAGALSVLFGLILAVRPGAGALGLLFVIGVYRDHPRRLPRRPGASAAQARPLSGTMPTDPLPSWNDGAAKSAILDFVARVTKEGGPDFVPPPERIATFDNDGTLWCEQPMQVQVFFLIDRVKQLAAKDPSLQGAPALQGVPRARSARRCTRSASRRLLELAFATHAGMSEEEFDAIAQGLVRVGEASEARPAVQATAPTSRRSSCSTTCAPTASRPSSSPAAASTSSAPSPRRPTASRASR